MSATYSYLRQSLISSLPQNPLITHETDWARLRDPHFLNRTLRYGRAAAPQCMASVHSVGILVCGVW